MYQTNIELNNQSVLLKSNNKRTMQLITQFRQITIDNKNVLLFILYSHTNYL